MTGSFWGKFAVKNIHITSSLHFPITNSPWQMSNNGRYSLVFFTEESKKIDIFAFRKRNRTLDERTERFLISSALDCLPNSASQCRQVWLASVVDYQQEAITAQRLVPEGMYLQGWFFIYTIASSGLCLQAQFSSQVFDLSKGLCSPLLCQQKRALFHVFGNVLSISYFWTWQHKLLSWFCTQFWS